MALQVGDTVPNFTCEAYVNGDIKKISLSDYHGKWVVLFFYPLDFTFVCPTELTGFAKAEQEFTKCNAVVLGASTDSAHSHKAWFSRDLSVVKYPVLADTNHRLSEMFNVLIRDQGIALRGTFIIDPDGVLKYQVVSALNIGRSITETIRVLQALQTGGLCPVDWHPGQDTLKPR
ncbi:peroxiredoxin [Candidatus Woesearchaeota archaeon]|nr:peroxiredoxin [Candidatus Woesearchaeota archaeon]